MEMIPLVKTHMPSKEVLMPALEKVLYSGYVAQGEQVDLFERAFETYVGGGHSLSLNSGTAALHVALILAGIKPGDEVISTALTAEPTNVAIKMVGAKIRYADIDENTGALDPLSIQSCINERTKAIMVVDYAGIPVDVKTITLVADKHGLPVIEDAAHALGSKFMGIKAGRHFPYTVFSFQAIKHLTTVDGGMLQVDDEENYEQGKLIRWFGIDKKRTRLDNDIVRQGFKYHMNNVNATIGLVQLAGIDSIIDAHVSNGQYLDKHLQGVPGLDCLTYYPDSQPSYWLYTVLVDNREGLIRKLGEQGFMASELHKRSDWHTYLNDFHQSLPVLDRFYKRMLHLPCGWWLSNEDRERMVSVIKSGW